MSTTEKYKIYYYKALGRANQIRLVLAAAGVEDWDEEHASSGYPPSEEDITKWRKIGGNTTTNIPMLVITDTATGKESVYCQSSAVVRVVGRKFNFLPKDDDDAMYVIDKIIADAEDIRSLAYKTAPEFGVTSDIINKYIQIDLKNHLDNFERMLSGEWFVNNKLSLADIVAYDAIITFNVNRVPGSLNNYPKLQAWKKRFEEIPGIAKYLSSPLYESLWKMSIVTENSS